MNSFQMQTLISTLVPFLIVVFLYAVFLKISARVLRYQITWMSCFLFAIIMFILIVVARRLWPPSGQPITVVIGHISARIAAVTVLGSWFFRYRAINSVGKAVG
jgi:hypothetical protein